MLLFVAAIKTEIIEELERHRDAELAEQREKRHKADAEKARKNAEQSTDTDESKVCLVFRSPSVFRYAHLCLYFYKFLAEC